MTKSLKAEEEYFAREEAEKIKRFAEEKNKKIQEEEKKRLKEFHWMKCPKCGMELHPINYKGVTIDKCFDCHGVYLDNGELELLAGHEDSTFIKTLTDLFKKS